MFPKIEMQIESYQRRSVDLSWSPVLSWLEPSQFELAWRPFGICARVEWPIICDRSMQCPIPPPIIISYCVWKRKQFPNNFEQFRTIWLPFLFECKCKSKTKLSIARHRGERNYFVFAGGAFYSCFSVGRRFREPPTWRLSCGCPWRPSVYFLFLPL